MSNQRERALLALATVVSLFAISMLPLLAPTIGLAAMTARATPVAQHARTLNVRDEGQLRFVRGAGSQVIDEGHMAGTFPGWVRARFTYNGEPTVTAAITIYGNGGTISARGSGRLSNPVAANPSFRGHMHATGGTGRYVHINGHGELFGVFHRRSYGLVVQAIGRLSY
jgi:hypothetical protein